MASAQSDTLTQERQLLSAVLTGDQKAWRRFRQRYDKLIGLCVRKALRRYQARQNQDDIEDIIADVWLQLLADDCRRLRCFDASRGLRLGTWLGQITNNFTIDQLRRRKNESYLEDIADRDSLAVIHATPHDHLEKRQAYALAQRAIEGLNEHDRCFLLACLNDDRTPADMAEELGVSVNTVYSRRFKVRAKLSRLVSVLDAPLPVAAPSMAA